MHIVAASGPAHIDTVPAYYTVDYQIEHATTRQLLAYPTDVYASTSSPGWTADTTPAADVATDVPTVANGGITNGGKTYTFHIKPGVDWNTSPPRQVTSQDFLREFKAFFNPVSPVGNPVYYTSTIAGLAAYDNAETAYFANKAHAPTAANITNFQDTHSISGIATPDPSTIQFTLIAPASDFLYMLAMPFTSARPVEYDSYVPNSLQLDQHTIADGPYQISSYVPGKSLMLVRNPAWKQSTDPQRHQYVNQVVDTNLPRRAMRPVRREIQMIFQDPYSSLNPRRRVGSIIGEPAGKSRRAEESLRALAPFLAPLRLMEPSGDPLPSYRHMMPVVSTAVLALAVNNVLR